MIGSAYRHPPYQRRSNTRSGSSREHYVVVRAGLFNEFSDEYRLVVRGCPDQRHRAVQGVAPIVVRRPPDDLIQQIWLEASPQRRACQERILNLAILSATELALRQEPLAQAVVPDRSPRVDSANSSASAARPMNTSPEKVLSSGWRSAIDSANSNTSAPSAKPVKIRRRASRPSRSVGRLVAITHNLRRTTRSCIPRRSLQLGRADPSAQSPQPARLEPHI